MKASIALLSHFIASIKDFFQMTLYLYKIPLCLAVNCWIKITENICYLGEINIL